MEPASWLDKKLTQGKSPSFFRVQVQRFFVELLIPVYFPAFLSCISNSKLKTFFLYEIDYVALTWLFLKNKFDIPCKVFILQDIARHFSRTTNYSWSSPFFRFFSFSSGLFRPFVNYSALTASLLFFLYTLTSLLIYRLYTNFALSSLGTSHPNPIS